MKTPIRQRLALAAVLPVLGSLSANAATSFTGGNVYSAAQWSGGLPSVGNDGAIATNGTFSGNINFNISTAGSVTVDHTSGALTGDSLNLRNDAAGGAIYHWNQSGGSVTGSFLVVNNRVVYTLSGGNLSATGSPAGGSRIQVVNTGTFNQTGGTVTGLGYDFSSTSATTHLLTGGSGVNLGASWTGPGIWVFRVSNLNTVQLGGNYTASFRNFTLAEFIIGSTGVLDIQNDWTGALTNAGFTDETGWESVLTQTGVRVNGTQVTAGNFDDFFTITGGGATVGLVPEPSSALLGGLGLVVLLHRRRKF